MRLSCTAAEPAFAAPSNFIGPVQAPRPLRIVEQDHTSARIAIDVAADRLLTLTDVPALMRDFVTPDAQPIDRIGVDQLADPRLEQAQLQRARSDRDARHGLRAPMASPARS